MASWLLNRLFDAKHQAAPKYAFLGTINWMSALAILVDMPLFNDQNLKNHYKGVTRRTPNIEADTLALENITMALHYSAGLISINQNIKNRYDLVRLSIISWYYVIYSVCSAMILVASGNNSKSHTGTAKIWQNNIVENNWAIGPFALSIKNLEPKNIETEIRQIRNTNFYNDLNRCPSNENEAWGGVYSYLKGTADYEKWKIEEKVKNSKEFRNLGLSNFRTKEAQNLRNNRLSNGMVNFLIQAFRFRGKANYRDSIYLSYGDDKQTDINQFTKNLEKVAQKFIRMASFYIAGRVEQNTWDEFIKDLDANLKINIDLDILKI